MYLAFRDSRRADCIPRAEEAGRMPTIAGMEDSHFMVAQDDTLCGKIRGAIVRIENAWKSGPAPK